MLMLAEEKGEAWTEKPLWRCKKSSWYLREVWRDVVEPY